MSDTIQAGETEEASRTKMTLIVAVLVTVAVLTGATVAVAWGGGPNREAVATTAPSASWMQDACEQWMGTYAGVTPPTSSWCASMWSWMQNAGPQMMGMMWWGDPAQFRTACINRTQGGANAQAWCDAMTTWMQNRAAQYGGWGPWMLQPSP
jgi:hypothetical protein